MAWPSKTEARIDTWVETGVEVSGELHPLADASCNSSHAVSTACTAWWLSVGSVCLPGPCPSPYLTECLLASYVAAFYDSLLAKLMVHSPEGRPAAIAKLQAALDETQVRLGPL